MHVQNLRLFILLFFVVGSFTNLNAQSQDLTPWTDADKIYGNQWIDYSKKYARVAVTTDGVYKVTFANLNAKQTGTAINQSNVQIWHRGKQVTPIEVTPTDVTFYGTRNDGVSDGLLYRPGPEARLDQTTSLFSVAGAYFFTAAINPTRIQSVSGAPNGTTVAETYHTETFTKSNGNVFSSINRRRVFGGTNAPNIGFTKTSSLQISTLHNSFYDRDKVFAELFGGGVNRSEGITTSGNVTYPFELKNIVTTGAFTAQISYLLMGNSERSHSVSVSATPEGGAEGNIQTNYTFNGFSANNISGINFMPTTHFAANGKGVLTFKSDIPSDLVGVSYFKIRYPQQLNATGENVKFLNFDNNVTGKRKLKIIGASGLTNVVNISDPYNPRLITNSLVSGTDRELDFDRETGKSAKLVLFNSTGVSTIGTAQIHVVNHTPLFQSTIHSQPTIASGMNPAAFDYLIITSRSTATVVLGDEPIRYAEYRASNEGGGFNTVLVDIRSIYDQFNYGEPSPVAIRRFTDYMISRGVRIKHNLLLIGRSTESFTANTVIELPFNVPSIGDPASDALLVSELKNSPYLEKDVPAIPIGRIPASSAAHVTAYLNKVKQYEAQTLRGNGDGSLAWRKTMINMVGAKTQNELPQFDNYFQNALSNANVDQNIWSITNMSNQAYFENPDLTNPFLDAKLYEKQSNGEFFGVLNYFGHGDINVTQYNIFDPVSKAYPDVSSGAKYPFLFITGCGIGNIYTGVTSNTMATNWINTANKGAIGMIANTWKAYTSTADAYMRLFFKKMYGVNDQNRLTIGQSYVAMANESLGGSSSGRVAFNEYDVANIHQSAIFGDPAMGILGFLPNNALPVSYKSVTASLVEDKSTLIQWETSSEVDNNYFVVEKSRDGALFEVVGEIKSTSKDGEGQKYSIIDLNPYLGVNYYRVKQVDNVNSTGDGLVYSYSKLVSVELNGDISVFPNPAVDKFNLTLSKQIKLQSWSLINSLGNKISSGTSGVIELKGIPVGSYIVELNTDSGVIRKRVVKSEK